MHIFMKDPRNAFWMIRERIRDFIPFGGFGRFC